MTIAADGALGDDIHFFAARIESKAKLAYDNVSDWLEEQGEWQPQNDAIAEQIRLLHRVCLARSEWRTTHALVFKDRPDYRFLLGEKGDVLDIVVEHRRIANRIVEEAMIAANVCAAIVLRDKLGFGIYNVHNGFDPVSIDQAVTVLDTHGVQADAQTLLTLEGFCKLRRELDAQPTQFWIAVFAASSLSRKSASHGAALWSGAGSLCHWTSLSVNTAIW